MVQLQEKANDGIASIKPSPKPLNTLTLDPLIQNALTPKQTTPLIVKTQESLRLTDDFEKNEFDWLIEDIFDKGRLHMVCGPQGSGKTRFLMRLIHDWSKSLPVLGKISHGAPFVYIDAARDRKSIKVALRSLDIPPSEFFIIDWLASRLTFHQMLQSIPKETEVIFIDNMAMMLSNDNAHDPSNSYGNVIKFLSNLKTWLVENNKTIIFTHTFIKAEVGHKYASPKSKVYGAQAWLQASETTILFDEENPQDLQDPYRIIDILCKNYKVKSFERRYRLENNGLLTPAPKMPSLVKDNNDEEPSRPRYGVNKDEYKDLLQYFPPSPTLIDAITIGNQTNLSRSTCYRYLTKLVEGGQVEKIGKMFKLK